ncbi:MAG TPA: hypothetical protein VE422_17075, partial [Terriglobia bacterium]|nr:hypothetical protein [Terriglobia bacterium]
IGVAKIMCEDAVADQPGDAAEKDSRCDQEGRRAALAFRTSGWIHAGRIVRQARLAAVAAKGTA